jgi:hypothetical protein
MRGPDDDVVRAVEEKWDPANPRGHTTTASMFARSTPRAAAGADGRFPVHPKRGFRGIDVGPPNPHCFKPSGATRRYSPPPSHPSPSPNWDRNAI